MSGLYVAVYVSGALKVRRMYVEGNVLGTGSMYVYGGRVCVDGVYVRVPVQGGYLSYHLRCCSTHGGHTKTARQFHPQFWQQVGWLAVQW